MAVRPPKPDFMTDEAWEALMAGREAGRIRASGKAHAEAYAQSGGGEGLTETLGGPTLLITTTGRKSGNQVVSPINYVQDGENVYVVGSLAGLEEHPHWALNLTKDPNAWVQLGTKKWAVSARLITGDERTQLWPRLVSHFPLWGHFQQYSDREFKVFVLSPRAE
ncbi:MAG: nitroreductase family deazaflavin-dependent oxidoreductase [Dehalococcoidia bacterium]|nr:nitroreductase family deazaflavin-dependent oxidoreductase [Dehalococcoidia bacterium]